MHSKNLLKTIASVTFSQQTCKLKRQKPVYNQLMFFFFSSQFTLLFAFMLLCYALLSSALLCYACDLRARQYCGKQSYLSLLWQTWDVQSLINNRMGSTSINREAFEVGSKGWVWSRGSIQDPWNAGIHLRAARTRVKRAFQSSRSLFPDWPWLCDESSPHRRALHIPVQILMGKFKMEFLPTVQYHKSISYSTDSSKLA